MEQLKQLLSVFEAFDRANWIAFCTASLGVGLSLTNLIIGGQRQRRNNRREEFHRRVAVPIESVLDDFSSLQNDVQALPLEGELVGEAVESLMGKATSSQSRLSQKLRLASSSAWCASDGWNVGENEYDDFTQAIVDFRATPSSEPRNRAAAALVHHEEAIRKRIDRELVAHTKGWLGRFCFWTASFFRKSRR